MLTVGSLFSGIGGFDLGLERAGMRTLWFCEQDEFCQRVLGRHWPGVPCHPDVRALVADACVSGRREGSRELGGVRAEKRSARQGMQVPVPHVDVLCGGFPCQDISLAGKGAGIEGERSGLWGEYARLVGELRPRYVIVENVAALLGRGLERVLGDLAALGYDAEWDCLPASAFGAPHRRDRLWLVAYPTGGRGGALGTAGISEAWADVGAGGAGSGRRTDPYPDGRRCEERSQLDGDEARSQLTTPQRDDAGGLRAKLADAERPRLQGITGGGSKGAWRPPSLTAGFGEGLGGQWLPEPDVRGVLDGLSQGLDGGVDVGQRLDSVERSPRGAEDTVRGVWEHVAARAASHRRRSDQQLARELADALSSLPHDLALGERQGAVASAFSCVRGLRQACEALGAVRDASEPLAEAWLALSAEDQEWCWLAVGGGRWAAEWPGVGRVAQGIPNRVDRLRSLGNSLVPQIAEWIGRRIIEWEEGPPDV